MVRNVGKFEDFFFKLLIVGSFINLSGCNEKVDHPKQSEQDHKVRYKDLRLDEKHRDMALLFHSENKIGEDDLEIFRKKYYNSSAKFSVSLFNLEDNKYYNSKMPKEFYAIIEVGGDVFYVYPKRYSDLEFFYKRRYE